MLDCAKGAVDVLPLQSMMLVVFTAVFELLLQRGTPALTCLVVNSVSGGDLVTVNVYDNGVLAHVGPPRDPEGLA